MNRNDFMDLARARIQKMSDTFVNRENKYAVDEDRLVQFKMIAELTGLEPEQVILVLVAKHFTGLVLAVNYPERFLSEEFRENLFTDIPNYSILMEVIVKERIENGSKPEEN